MPNRDGPRGRPADFADDAWEDAEYPDPDAWDDDPSGDVIPCPECGAEIYDDSPRCPACGEYITTGASVWAGRAWWWILLGLLGVVGVLLTLTLAL